MKQETQNASSELGFLVFVLFGLIFCGAVSVKAQDKQPRSLQFRQFTLSAGSTYFEYEEPGVMSEDGFLHGVRGSYIHGESNSFGVETTMEVWGGGLEYDGATFDDTPVTTSTDDSIYRVSAKIGRFIDAESGIYFPYGGLGYRFWDDTISGSSQSIETTREIEYFYLPIGISAYPRMEGPWYFSGRFELQALLSGEVLFQDQFTLSQDSGYGGKLSATLNRELPHTGKLGLELFTQYWDIDQSDLSDQTITIDGTAFSLVEPANTTFMLGLRGTVDF